MSPDADFSSPARANASVGEGNRVAVEGADIVDNPSASLGEGPGSAPSPRASRAGEENLGASVDDPVGVAYAIFAYVLWGIVPLYWRLLDGVPPFELTVHRIVWC